MSIALCIGAFLAVLFFLLVIVVVWLISKPDEGSLTAREALREIKASSYFVDKLFSYLVYLTRFFWRGLLGLISAMALAAFACLGSICSPNGIEALKIILLILLKLFAFLEKISAA